MTVWGALLIFSPYDWLKHPQITYLHRYSCLHVYTSVCLCATGVLHLHGPFKVGAENFVRPQLSEVNVGG